MDLQNLTLDALAQLQADIDGELARRSSGSLSLDGDGDGRRAPRGGALLCDRPAIGGDRNTTTWYPSLEAANAALMRMANGLRVSTRTDGGLYLDYTSPGCRESCAYVVAPPQEKHDPE